MEHLEEDHIIVPRKPTSNSDRIVKAIELTKELPYTYEGTKAAIGVMELIDSLHRARLDSVESIFASIRLIFESFKIKLDI